MPQITGLNETIHSPLRLQIMAILCAVDGQVEFQFIRDHLDISDSVLSKHLKVLTEANYATLERSISRGRSRAWITATRAGRQAYKRHIAALREIVGDAQFQ